LANGIRYHTGALRSFLLCTLLCATAFAQSALEQAVNLARQKRWMEASKLLQGVKEPAPRNQRIAFHRLRAAIASGLGENTAAVQEMRAALQLSPADPSLLLATAVAESQAGLLDDALGHAGQAGNIPAAKALIGGIEEKRSDYARSVEAYQAAIVLAPNEEQYRLDLAFEWIRHQNFRPAIDLLRRSAALFPRSGEVRTLLGIAQYAEGETGDAENTFEDAIKVDPGLDSAYRCLAEIVLQSSAAPPESIRQSLCAWNSVVCSALKLRVARENGNARLEQEAIAGLKLAPSDSMVGRCELARALEWTGRLEDARKELEACVYLDPLPQNHYRLALLYKKLGFTDLARRELELRSEMLQHMSEQTALGLSALQSLDPH
jgi:tetratricopeptide (TPR) repeat protein